MISPTVSKHNPDNKPLYDGCWQTWGALVQYNTVIEGHRDLLQDILGDASDRLPANSFPCRLGETMGQFLWGHYVDDGDQRDDDTGSDS